MFRVLADDDIDAVLDLDALLDVVESGVIAQSRGTVERPPRPHVPIGRDLEADDPLGTGLVMPAYVHGQGVFATKLVGVFEGNRDRGLPTIHAAIVLLDARTGQPVALLEGTRITNARTGCIGGLAAKSLTEGPIALGVLGAGQQARWQTRAIGAACPVSHVGIYAPSTSREDCADDLVAEGFDAVAVDSPADAVEGSDVVVTATTSAEPVFPADALDEPVVVIAIGAYTSSMQELEPAVVERAAQVFADVPSEVAEIGDIANASIDPGELIEFGGLLAGDVPPARDADIILVESVGSAVYDAVASEHLLERGIIEGLGVELDLG